MIIICRTCKKQKPEESFGFYAGRLRRNCEDCRKWLQDYNKKNRDHLLEMRRFRYHTDPERKVAKANAKYMQDKRANPKRKKQLYANHLMRKYGVSLEQYENMLKIQDGRCAICGISFEEKTDGESWKKKVPCLDHCHKTNKARGLLCRSCNLALSYIEDFKFLEKAKEYLRINEAEDKEPLT